MNMSSKYSKNFLVGDIVAVECKVSSNYLHSSGEISLVPMHGSKTSIFIQEDNITMIRPFLAKGDAVMFEGYVFNVVAQDIETEQTWISRNDGATNRVVQSSELTRLIYAEVEPLVPGESLQESSGTADALAYAFSPTKPAPDAVWRDAEQDVEEAPPPAPAPVDPGEDMAYARGPRRHDFIPSLEVRAEGETELCDECGEPESAAQHVEVQF